MITPSPDADPNDCREALAAWREESRKLTAERDALVRSALDVGLSKEEVHQLSGLGRTTIDRIVRKVGQQIPVSSSEVRVALYRLFSKSGELLYIGITTDLDRRFCQHGTTKRWWGDVERKSILWLSSWAEAVAMESRLIRAESPKYNVRPGGNWVTVPPIS